MSKKDDAIEAVDALFSDTEFSQHETLEMLQEVRERCDDLMECIREDLRRTENE